MALVEVKVPDIGDFVDVPIIELLVKPGDPVAIEQGLITVESDKASMEVPSSHAGVVKELKIKLGDKVSQGTSLLVLETAAASAPDIALTGATTAAAMEEAPSAPHEAAAPEVCAPPAKPSAVNENYLRSSPSIRKLAREMGVALEEVNGTGPRGRIQREDVLRFSRSVMSGATRSNTQTAGAASGASESAALPSLLPWPKIDFSRFGPIDIQPVARIKKISGANLARNWVMIPHVTNQDEADITELDAFRVRLNKENEKSGHKVTLLAFMVRALVAALKKFPEFNASLDGDQLVLKQYFHIGFAADTSNGLVVPVIKNADQKGVLQIAQEMADLSRQAREGKLGAADMQGGCFTISSLGGIGGTAFTPIINAPEVAILGLSKTQIKPVWDGTQFVPRQILPLSLSYDHRVIDGAAAARFNGCLGGLLTDFRRVLL